MDYAVKPPYIPPEDRLLTNKDIDELNYCSEPILNKLKKDYANKL